MAKRYRPRPGFHVSPKIAQRAGEVVEKLGIGATPLAFLDVARTDTILRKCFEWDDAKAAHEHRLTVARTIMRSFTVHVHYERREITVTGARHLDSVGGYVPASALYKTAYKDLLEESIAAALGDARSWVMRYTALRGVSEIGPVFEALDRWLERSEKKDAAE